MFNSQAEEGIFFDISRTLFTSQRTDGLELETIVGFVYYKYTFKPCRVTRSLDTWCSSVCLHYQVELESSPTIGVAPVVTH